MTPPRAERNRVLVVMPTWIGDAVMATPALHALRAALPGAYIGALLRQGVDEIVQGLDVFDAVHHAPSGGIMAPKVAGQRIRHERYSAALLLTNSFSTALSTRLAGIPRRVGYERDGRAMLLTQTMHAPRRSHTPPYNRSRTNPGAWAPVPACDYYLAITRFVLRGDPTATDIRHTPLTLATTPDDESHTDAILARAGVRHGARLVVLNPGANDEKKRWPADRFAALAAVLSREPNTRVLVNGAPAEAALANDIADAANALLAENGAPDAPVVALPGLGITLGALKALLRRADLLVTNDTGPRHIAAAFATPVVALFGPTDHRWTTITDYLPPARNARATPIETILLADPTLPEEEVANDHPDRCAINNITLDQTLQAARAALQP